MGGTDDSLNIFGDPTIDLPMDDGDGPFWGTASTGPRAPMASSDIGFRREEPFQENMLTNNRIFGPSDRIAVGRVDISDIIPANSYRRISQHFSLRSVAALGAVPVIIFQGNPWAIIEEGVNMLAPTPTTGTDSAIESRPLDYAPPSGPATRSGPSSLERAMDTLSALQENIRPTMSIQTSSFQIKFRIPGFQQEGSASAISPSDIMCFDPSKPASPLARANTEVEFFFGNSGGFLKEFALPYPVGDSVPIIFDIINHNPVYAVQAAFSVAVMVDRSGSY